MRAMVLAAGVGSRLKPLTDETPKALIEVGGAPMLEIVLKRLIEAGVDAAIVNVFHLGGMIEDFLKDKKGFGIRVEVSRESELLDTGGGLLKAAPFFDDGKPFFLHNADVMTDLDLGEMYRAHERDDDLATLAVSRRDSGRKLLFDRDGLLRGRESEEGREWAAGPVPAAETLAFNGIHVISPRIFPRISERGAFPIMRSYLRLAGEGESIRAFRMDRCYWRDVGGLEKLETARMEAKAKAQEKRGR